jgi:integrase
LPKKRLTEGFVERLQGTKGAQVYWFDDKVTGLCLCVGARRKTWYAIHYIGNKTRYHWLGHFPDFSVAQAREKAKEFLRDPQAALAHVDVGSFESVAKEFITRHVAGTRTRVELRSRKEIERCINKYVLPSWKDLTFTEIKSPHVTALLDRIEDRHGAPQADAVLAIIRKIFNWHRSRVGPEFVVPIVAAMKRDNRSASERARSRILNADEIRAVWKACDECGTFGALLKMALLTAQRKAKVETVRWTDLVTVTESDASVHTEWKVRKEPREKGTPERLRLPQMVVEIINTQPHIDGNPYVFPAARGVGPFASFSEWKAKLDEKLPAEMPRWTIHDLRRTARSLLSRVVTPDTAERVLGHTVAGVRGIYDHHDYAPEIADALQKLALVIDRIVNPPAGDNVIVLPQRSAAG